MTKLAAMEDVRAICVGKEVAPTTGKQHYQTYVRFENNKRLSWLIKQFPGSHWELRRGSEPEAAQYCRKEGTVLHDRGCAIEVESSPIQDAFNTCVDMLEDGAPLWQIYKTNRKFYCYNRGWIRGVASDIKEWGPKCKRHKPDDSDPPPA